MKARIIVGSAILSAAWISVSAQDKNLTDQQINVVKPYQPTLSEAQKINGVPAADTSTYKVPLLKYSIKDLQYDVPIIITPIKPLRLKDEPIPKLYRNYVKLGYGNYNSPYAEAFVNSLRAEKFQAGVHLKYNSTNGKMQDLGKVSYSDLLGDIYGLGLVGNEEVRAQIAYRGNGIQYYGGLTDSTDKPVGNNTTKLNYSLINGAVQLSNRTNKENTLQHQLGVSVYNLNSKLFKETGAIVTAVAAKTIPAATFGVKAVIDNNNTDFTGIGTTQGRTVIDIAPFAEKADVNYAVKGGLSVQFEAGDTSAVHFYPNLDAHVNLAENFLIAYASVNGGVTKNTLKQVYETNPFLAQDIKLLSTNKKYEIQAGLRGTLSNTTSFGLGIGLKKEANAAFFVNSIRDIDTISQKPIGRDFMLVYDKLNTFYVHLELGYLLTEKTSVLLKADYFNYRTDSILKPWQRPALQLSFSANYNLADKITLRSDIYFWGPRYVPNYEMGPNGLQLVQNEETKEMPSFADINLGLEYRYKKQLSFFLNLSNLAASRYEYWYLYPVQRFGVLGGLTFSF